MLDKDQYNQDEYNNYYKQETEGAEIKGFENNEGGFLKKAILFLGLIALGVAGYFGFKMSNNTDENKVTKEKLVIKEEAPKNTEKTVHENQTVENRTIEDKVIETIEQNKEKIDKVAINTEKTARELEERAKAVEDKMEASIQKEVAAQVQEKLENNQKMSKQAISDIVNTIMKKMEKEKLETAKTNKDNDLLSALANNDVVETTEPKETKTIATHVVSTVKEDATTSVNTNNKVTLDKDSKSNDNELTKLSEQIRKLLNMSGANDTSKKTTTPTVSIEGSSQTVTNYESSISREIKVRTNEMRVIVVRPGDTLNKISQRAYGSSKSFQKIIDANPDISRADRIYVGQKLRIPK